MNFLEILLSGACQDILSNMKYKLLNLVPHTVIKEAQCSIKLFGVESLYVPHLSVKLPISIGEQSGEKKKKRKLWSNPRLHCILLYHLGLIIPTDSMIFEVSMVTRNAIQSL